MMAYVIRGAVQWDILGDDEEIRDEGWDRWYDTIIEVMNESRSGIKHT